MESSEKYAQGLAKTRAGFGSRLAFLFRSRKTEKEFFQDLEEILVSSDVGVVTATRIVGEFREYAAQRALIGSENLQQAFIDFLTPLVTLPAPVLAPGGLRVILLLGVNGSGKTTTTGKLAARYAAQGEKVLLAAADTFRAAAIEQLAEWANRSGVDFVRQQQGADPGAVVFDAMDAARARGCTLVLVDTAGRFHNRENLVRELAKIDRIVGSKIGPDDQYLKLIVLDATAGGNAFTQAKSFHEAVPLSGAVLTKMDSSAKGGVVLPLTIELKLPLFMIGVGEGIDDLVPFDPELYVKSLF